MKVLLFLVLLLAILASPLTAQAQQELPTATPTLEASASPSVTPLPADTAAPSPTLDPLPTVEPSPSLTPTWLPSETPAFPPPLAPNLNAQASFFSRLNLPGPALAAADLYDLSGQFILSVPLNADGSFGISLPGGAYLLRLRVPGFLMLEKPLNLLAGQTLDLGVVSLPAGDVNGDNSIDQSDLMSMGAVYEQPFLASTSLDLNRDGLVDLFDLTLLARSWGQRGPVTGQ